MSRLTDTTSQGQHLEHDFNADKSAFVSRLQTILAHWPSADRLARAMGVSPSAFRKWLKGEAEPSRERLVALARTTGVGVAWLAEGEGPRLPPLNNLDGLNLDNAPAVYAPAAPVYGAQPVGRVKIQASILQIFSFFYKNNNIYFVFCPGLPWT